MSKNRQRTTILRTLLGFHRYMGLIVAAFAIHLSLTGILLNHTDELGFSRAHISDSRILNWYGIEQPESLQGYQLGQHWITLWHNTIYFDGKPVAGDVSRLSGATRSSHFNVIATPEEIWLLTIDGDIIERLNTPAEKLGDVIAIGQQNEMVVIKTEQGIFQADSDLISWHQLTTQDISWPELRKLPKATLQAILDQQHSISWERFLLDFHSGRLFGMSGVILIDLAGLLLLFLAISGVTIWYKRRRRTMS